jgi:hypothetical protein
MADINVKILTPATSFALMTLAELKVALGIPTSNTTSDAQLQLMIDTSSATAARLCNRVFAKEKVLESWRCQQSRRTFLSHWPVKESDIESVTTNGFDNIDWELEEASGKLSIFSNRAEPIIVTYTGGYDLPTEAPPELKQAVTLMVATEKAELAAIAVTGIRMIAHKESRVMFHSPAKVGGAGGGPVGMGVMPAVEAILSHFMRPWV